MHLRLSAALNVPVEELTYDTTTHEACPTCHGRGAVPIRPAAPTGAAA